MIYAKDEKIQHENVVLERIYICNSTSFWKTTSVIPTMSRARSWCRRTWQAVIWVIWEMKHCACVTLRVSPYPQLRYNWRSWATSASHTAHTSVCPEFGYGGFAEWCTGAFSERVDSFFGAPLSDKSQGEAEAPRVAAEQWGVRRSACLAKLLSPGSTGLQTPGFDYLHPASPIINSFMHSLVHKPHPFPTPICSRTQCKSLPDETEKFKHEATASRGSVPLQLNNDSATALLAFIINSSFLNGALKMVLSSLKKGCSLSQSLSESLFWSTQTRPRCQQQLSAPTN